jgi:hypothetical protein
MRLTNLPRDSGFSLFVYSLIIFEFSLVHLGQKLSNIHNDKFEGRYDFLVVIFPLAREVDLLVGILASSINSGVDRPLLALQKNQYAIFDDSLVLPIVKEYVLDLSRAQELFFEILSILSATLDAT